MALQKPGEDPHKPGEYREVSREGSKVLGGRTVTMERGDKPLPPTQKKYRKWKWVGPPRA